MPELIPAAPGSPEWLAAQRAGIDNVCPVCGGYVARRENGTLYLHLRCADGAGPGPNQDHRFVACEGGSDE